ncbi:hypothetical protein Enr17x_54470 [Gimesia fumaroli]|uniref:Uncharacterized protein n=1 Tax=Gimesia fumaroli TaxID=2527976 RepID=A0A518IJU0_9PLAN|nr:hypothetical protein Enr17x_54470 [Gimesia fumaroli]
MIQQANKPRNSDLVSHFLFEIEKMNHDIAVTQGRYSLCKQRLLNKDKLYIIYLNNRLLLTKSVGSFQMEAYFTVLSNPESMNYVANHLITYRSEKKDVKTNEGRFYAH